MKVVAPGAFRELALRRLPKFLFEYIDGGGYAEVTLERNVAELETVALRQRVLRDVSDIDTSARNGKGRDSLSNAEYLR
jgi:L-lactate dehydrogenase (cytochrome)